MKKKSFVLSWGRKMFFGLGWALTSLMALNYFQSMIIPQTSVGWIYFLTTFIGHYGLILSLVYFLLYAPVISLFPSYYVSRIWSIVLLVSINLYIFLDSYVFTRFRFHLDSFLWNFLREQEALTAFGLTPVKLSAIGIVAVIIFFVLWYRGERLWRSMQARFSNPVKNWYLVLIAICLVTSQVMHMYGEANGSRYITRLSSIFPLHYNLDGSSVFEKKTAVNDNQGYKDFYYPSDALNCPMKQPKNVLLIVMDKWNAADFNSILTPNIAHFATHGTTYLNHYSGGLNQNDGYFSLMYSLSPNYAESVLNQNAAPVFLEQLKKSKIDTTFFQYGSNSPLHVYQPDEKEISLDYIESHLADRDDLSEVNPFFMQVYLGSESLTDKDNNAKTVIDLFIKHKLVKNTIIIITAAYADQMKTPLVVIWPGQGRGEVSTLTSHYDLLTTVMKEDWRCKNPVTDYSLGNSLFGASAAQEHVAGDYREIKIVDLNDQTITAIGQTSGLEVRDLNSMQIENEKKNTPMILNQLEKLTRFYKR
jgi:membrane-anchored protein YejM (alkaline phosphatase superfamily)